MNPNRDTAHCVKSVHIRSFSGPYSVQIRENTDQKNSKYGDSSRSGNGAVSKFIAINFRRLSERKDLKMSNLLKSRRSYPWTPYPYLQRINDSCEMKLSYFT